MKGLLIFGILLLGAHFGFSFPNEHQRIINGIYAVEKQFPYQVSFDILELSNLTLKSFEWKHHCGGTLISKRIILTAASCFSSQNIYAIKIHFGVVDQSNQSEIGQQELVVKRSNIVVHEEYELQRRAPPYNTLFKLYNDIALIKLPVDVAFDEYIRPAKLPQPGVIYNTNEATTSGWGDVKLKGSQRYDPKLKYFNSSILSHAECREWFKVLEMLPSSQICLAPSDSTFCERDSGGPLTVRHEGDFVVVGIASFGACQINKPSVFTRVASYLNWIHQNAGDNNLDL